MEPLPIAKTVQELMSRPPGAILQTLFDAQEMKPLLRRTVEEMLDDLGVQVTDASQAAREGPGGGGQAACPMCAEVLERQLAFAAYDRHVQAFAALRAGEASHLARVLFGQAPSAAWRLDQFLARLAQWELLLLLWDEICARAKLSGTGGEPLDELVLALALETFNASLAGDVQASWLATESGEAYAADRHQTLNVAGEHIQRVYLRGVRNAGGAVVRKSLVEAG